MSPVNHSFTRLKELQPNNIGNTSIADIVTQRLRSLILDGTLEAGYQFPNENDFCELWNIGRGTLREAYKILAEEGLIVRSKRGTYVKDLASSDLSFSTAIAISDHRDMLEFRTMFESELAYLAASRAKEEHIAELQSCIDSMCTNKDNLLLLSYYDMKYHQSICAAAQNKLLINIMQSLTKTFEKSIYAAFLEDTENNIQQAIFYHKTILDAIIMHDPKAAEEAMRKHVQKVYATSFP